MRAVVIAVSQYGQTFKISGYIKAYLEKEGLNVDVFKFEKKWNEPKVEDYDVVIIGCPVYMAKLDDKLTQWTQSNAQRINMKPSAFFAVSMNHADLAPEAKREDEQLLAGFVSKTGLKPVLTASFTGAIKYTKYSFFIRWVMRKISASKNGPIDTSQDYELTDWKEVDSFCTNLLSKLKLVQEVSSS